MNREEWLAQINENPNTNLLFLSVENTMLLFFDPPFPDVRGMSHCKEALKLIEKPFFLIAYSSRFDRKEKVEFFNKVSRERLESELEHNFDFLVPDSWIGIQKSSKDDISKDLIKFWDDCLYPQKVKRLAAFIDGRIKKDAGWGESPRSLQSPPAASLSSLPFGKWPVGVMITATWQFMGFVVGGKMGTGLCALSVTPPRPPLSHMTFSRFSGHRVRQQV